MFALAHDTGSFQKANGPYLLLPDGSALLRRNLIPTLDKACFWRRRQLTQKPSIILPDPDGLLKGTAMRSCAATAFFTEALEPISFL